MPADLVPRSMKVLDDARDVPERELIEGVYGVDMSDCRVIVDRVQAADRRRDLQGLPQGVEGAHPLGPGPEFWLGFLINDNDDPGTDVQDFLVWPADLQQLRAGRGRGPRDPRIAVRGSGRSYRSFTESSGK